MKIADQYNMAPSSALTAGQPLAIEGPIVGENPLVEMCQLLRRPPDTGCLQRFITLPSRRGYVRARPSDDDSGQRILTG